MRILQISSTDTSGGAGRAAYRLHRALLAAGIDSSMLVHSKSSDDDRVQELAQNHDFATFCGELAQSRYVDSLRSKDWNTHFSLAWPGIDLNANPLVKHADIIHLHWLWNFQSAATLAGLLNLGKPVVWSFHDQRAMTGGCHYSAGCRGYETDCAACPQLPGDRADVTVAALADQQHLWRHEAVTVIGLSHWMADCARHSSTWKNSRIEVIHNSVETDVYQPRDKRNSRHELGMPEDAVCVLFGADYGEEIRKGFGTLMRALKLCGNDPWYSKKLAEGGIRFMCFGHPDPSAADAPVPIHALGYLKDDVQLASAYSAADFFVLPSLEDNLPNTVLESMSCGTPVLALDVGGSRDMIVDGHTGWLVPPGEEPRLAATLLDIMRRPDDAAAMAAACRKRVLQGFSPEIQARKFASLYEELLRQQPGVSSPDPDVGPVVPARLDCGPRMRVTLPSIFRILADEIEAPCGESSSVARRQMRFRRILARKKINGGCYEVFLKELEMAYIASKGGDSYLKCRGRALKKWLHRITGNTK